MIRLATTYLLIAAVLPCPCECSGGAVAAGQERACCFQHQGDSCGDHGPQSPEEHDEDCLCRGAIIDGSRTVDDQLTSPVARQWALEIASPTALPLRAVSFESPRQFPPFATGRDVCALDVHSAALAAFSQASFARAPGHLSRDRLV